MLSKYVNQLRNNLQRILLAGLFLFVLLPSWSQIQKSGVVTDVHGDPLVGVSVVEVGTVNGTQTDATGRYSLSVRPGSKLRLTYVGFISQTITPGRSVVMKENQETLNEVVVVGYGTMRRKDVTSSITTVGTKDLNQGVFTDPAQMLQGRVAGLVVSSTADPGGTSSISLRGASSLRAGSAMQPYYVIDGIPGSDISMVAPSDIESIDVLRDASATAIYGSKAANGVIIITTKKGLAGRTTVTYDTYLAFDHTLRRLAMASAADLRASGLLVDDAGADINWQNEVLRTGISHSHNLSISGGNERTKYITSLNFISHDGVIRGTSMNRANARSLVSTRVLKNNLELSAGVNAMLGTHHGVPVTGYNQSVLDAMNYFSPTNPVKDKSGKWYESTFGTNNYNPLSLIHEDKNEFSWRRMQLIAKASLRIVDGLMWNTNYSYSIGQRSFASYDSSQSQIVKGYNGQARRSITNEEEHNMESFVNFDRKIGSLHRLGFMLGYSFEQHMNNDGFGITVHNFYDDTIGFHNISYANLINGMSDVQGGMKETIRNISFYGRANYAYNSRYMLQMTFRRDGSSVFGKHHRWGTFPSASIAWNVSEEDFMQGSIFDMLKLRVGYGVSGNALGFGAYTAVATYGLNTAGSFAYTSPDGTQTTYYKLEPTKNANPDLKWESTSMLNLGVDFTFLKGRLNGTIEVYNKKTWNLIWDYPVSTYSYPVPMFTANVGNISNRGIELTLNAIPLQSKDFLWNTSLTLSHNSNKVTKLTKGRFSVNYVEKGDPRIAGITGNGYTERIIEGKPLGTFYTYEWAGRNSNGVSQYYVHDPLTNERTGAVTTSPVVTDKTIVGYAQPKLVYGLNNTLSFRNWSLTAFVQGNFGNKILNTTRAQYSAQSLLSGGKNVLKSALTDPLWQHDPNYFIPSDQYLENGSYLRLSTLSLTYNFTNLGGWLHGLQVYATAKNVFTVTSYTGLDPEVELGGTEPGLDRRESFYPHTRSMMLGVKVNF